MSVSSYDDGSGVQARGGNEPSVFQSPDNNITLNQAHILKYIMYSINILTHDIIIIIKLSL
jgi:hypothetical protein